MGFAAGDASLVGKEGGRRVDSNDTFGAGQRLRLQLDAVASEALSGTVFFEIGDQLWERFNAPQHMQAWYFGNIEDGLLDLQDYYDTKRCYWEYNGLYKDLFVIFVVDEDKGLLYQLNVDGEDFVLKKGKPEWLPLEALFNSKWLNASTSMKAVEEEITTTLERINSDLDAIAKLPEYSFEALEEYKSTLHLGKAVVKANMLKEQALRKAEYEAAQARKREEKEQPQPAPVIEAVPDVENLPKNTRQERQWVSFEAFITVEDARALKAFFESRNIEFKAINS